MRFIAPLLAVLLVTSAATGGSTTGGVSGSIKDGSGHPVEGAEVRMTQASFGTHLTLKSDGKGRFVQVGIKAGDWDLVVHKDGLADANLKVHLGLGAPTPVAVVLESAGAGEPAASGEPAPSAGFALGGLKVSKEAGLAYHKAQEAMAAGDKDQARTALEDLIQLEPALPTPYFVLAQIYRDAGDGKKASELLAQGLAHKPDDVAAWLALGEVQSDRGEAEAAVNAFRKATEVAPSDPGPHRKLGMALVLKQDFAGAVAALENYLRLAPDAPDAAEKRVLVGELKKAVAK